jgi:hypothetical protein
MTAACAKHYGMKCVQFTGARKNMALAGEDLRAETDSKRTTPLRRECNRLLTTSIIAFHSSSSTDSLKIVPSPPDPPLVVVP